jgi:hypothetical protein
MLIQSINSNLPQDKVASFKFIRIFDRPTNPKNNTAIERIRG